GYSCSKQFGHAGFQVAAAPGILLPRRIISELSCNHDLHCHHYNLVCNTRKGNDRPAKLHTVLRVVERLLQGSLCNADSTRGGLDAGGFESLHQLFDAQSLDSTQQVLRLDREPIERDLVFLHAAIAKYLDFSAAHSLCGEWMLVITSLLFRQQHRQATMASFFWICSHEKGHQVGAHRMGYPGFVAVDSVDVALAHCARLDRGEVRTCIRLDTHRGRQYLTGGDFRQPFFLLRCGAAAENQFGRDFRAGTERTDADVTT